MKNNKTKGVLRVETNVEVEYIKSGGILKYVLNKITNKNS